MGLKKVFVSYDHSEDVHYKELLRAWDANTDFDFEFDLRSPNTAIESKESSVIQAVLTKKMKESEFMLVIIDEKSHSSKWMKWEIDRAKQADNNLKFAAVKIKPSNILPSDFPKNAPIAHGFELKKIEAALSNAVTNS